MSIKLNTAMRTGSTIVARSLSTLEGMDPYTLLHGHRTPKVIMIPNGILMAHTSTMVQ